MQAETVPPAQALRGRLQEAVGNGDASAAIVAARELLRLDRAADLAFCATAFRKLREALLVLGHRLLKTFLVRSATLEPMLPALHVEAVLHGYVLDVEVGGYGSYMEELIDPDGAIGRFGAELVFVLVDTEEIAGSLALLCARGQAEEIDAEVKTAAERMVQMLRAFRAGSKARLVVQGCLVPASTSLGMVGEANVPLSLTTALREVNRLLRAACGSLADCAYFDLDEAAAQFGRGRWRDERMFLATRLAVAPAAFGTYARGLLRTASPMFRPARKVLCTDLDNTLWGGILGEDGPEGIATGAAFPGNCYLAYQRYLKELAARGVLLAISSKNNPGDVQEAFRLRSADLAVGLDDFVAAKIGWGEKVTSLRELAAELSLGLDAFVFVDDNPTECEAVRQHLPEVAVVEVPVTEPWTLTRVLSDRWDFDTAVVTADDRNRTDEYRAQAQRASLSQNAASKEDFLSSLGIVCSFVSAAEAPLERAVQMLHKTNQFNLTTRRYSAGEVMGFAADPACQALAVRVRDRFGDAGVVGLALTRQADGLCTIDTFLLSCRVIGRGIETAMLAQIAEQARAHGARWLVGEYIETRKNAPCREFYPDHGFHKDMLLSGEGTVGYRLDLAESMPAFPSWLSVEGKEQHEFGNSALVVA